MINPSVPIRNIRMKFAVLIGLIQVGEVSNRDIVETVLNLLVGGEFDLEMNFIIQDAESITCMTELLEHCDVTCQAEIWSMFTAILRKSVRNLQTSTEVGLIEQVLLKMSAVDDMIADLLVDMLGVLASYSITVKELKLLFSMLRGESGIWAIALPPIAKWPYQNGFTLNTWFRMDPLNNINVDKDKPYLYCFRTSKGVGYSAHFVGNCLIVTSLKSKGKGFQHCVKYDFQPRKWYMISIVHIYNRWRNSEIRCYVNGQLVSYGDMAWHVNTNDSYDKCFLGSSETADANRVFCGQLGAVYVFSEALNPAQIFAIHQLGPGYKSTFKFKSESDIHLAEHHKQVLYDGKLASSIAFTYNAKATDAQLCLESSPKENASIFVHSPHALMLQDVKAIVTHSIHSAIHSIGGIQVLFPLFAQLDNRQLNDSQVETTVCATLLAFLVTYEAHKEYLAKMYEEYQRQEEENIKKGKKGNVSTISGLSSQTTGAKGGMEIREIEDLSQSQSPESETDYPVSTDTRDLLMSTKVSDDILGNSDRPGSGVHVEVHDLLVDIKAEKVEATEVKLDDMDLSPETLVGGENGALVEVESLLDNVYSAAVEKLQNNVHGSVGIIKKNEEKDNGPLITLADEKEELSSSSTSFLFDKIPKQEEKLLPELSSNHIIPNIQDTQVHLSVTDDLGLLAHMTGSVDLTCTSSIIEEKEFKIHTTSDGMSGISERDLASSTKGLEYAEMTATTLETESSGSKIVPNIDAGSIISDTERSDDGKESGKEIRKIQTTTTTQTPLENVPGNLSPIKDPDRLLQDVDINRLRAVVFRDVDDSKQAQFLALAVVYFISVLMVSKYRDILEPQRETARTGSQPGRNIRQEINSPTSTVVVIPSIPHPSLNHGFLAKLIPEQSFAHSFYKETPAAFPESVKEKETPTPGEDIQIESTIPHTDSGIGEEQVASILNGAELETSTGPDAMSELLSTLSSEVKKSQESLTEHPNEILKPAPSISSISQTKGINVKEILKSLVAAPVEIAECGPEPIPYPDPALKREAQAILPMQFHSFDRSVVVPVKKPPPGSLAVTTVGATTAGSGLPTGSTSNIFAATGATPKSMINTTGAVDSGSSSSSSSSSFVNGATSKNLPAVQTVAPMPEDSAENMSITAKLERALEKVAPLLREIFVDFAPFLSRTLLGSHGQELLIEGLVCMKSSTSVVELVMLLCSQEWQNSIQKNAGLAFIELINEGRLLCHAMKDHIVRVANEAEFILNRQRAEDVHKHAEFESQCAQYAADRREEEKMCDHLISAAKHRDHVTANQLKQKILNILTNKHGAWGAVSHSQLHDFWRLDYWEDDLRRRRRFVRNAFGSTHAEALLKAAIEYGTEEDVVKSKKTFRSQAIVNQNAETELMLEGDDDAVSLLQEKEIDNLAGPVVLSTPAQLIAPVVVAKGTLSITTTEIYFEVDEDDPAFKKIDTKVLAYTEGLHGKWMFSEIRAVFSRRYLLQNTALEVFMANRTSVMFNFPDQATVKKVVYSLPRVGVGTSYGLPQARRISLATPRQLYKSSNMTQRWQRREISNFEYLMFLNTIAGRTYNDLNQYPVFPWVLTNYESEELDLTLPGNFRDLSKPIGALNPKRAVFYAERYETWEDDQSPPYHYNTHYSTATSTLSWLVRIEPFTTFFLNANDGKFDHPDRTFSSVARSWRTSQRDTSDVKELIPEFYYLPEMFVNSNGYNLGVREDEVVVNDVDLPPWAKKPEDFVRINRMWIDLIFGYKQRGPEAVRALNVFHYLTYEGSVNLDSITDPVLREAMEAQIQNFGQTPSQLLIEPHPPRSSAMHLCFLPQSPLMFKDQMQQDVIMVLKFPSNSPVTHVAANTLPHLTIPAVVTVTCSRLFAVNRWHNTVGLRGAPGYSLDQAHHLPIEMDPLIANNSGVNKRQITDLVDQSIQINAHCFVVTADNRYILICGFWDKSFRVYSTETGKLTQIVFGHWDVVTCLARSESYIGGDCYIVSGSRDATLLLWYWSGRHHIIGDNPNSSDYPAPRAVLTGHDHEVVCVSVCAELGLVISGAKEGPCLVHTITGDLLRALEGPENCLFPRLISVSSEGHCIIYYERGRFSNFSINGKLLAQMEINDSTRAILLSSDGQNLVTGGDNGVVEVWQACDFKQLYIYPGCDAGIRAMDLSHDQRTLITGMASGSIVAFNIDFNRWHYEHQNRY
ncbi:Neurobeachin [Tupaia chinensis]|uniref:Neurobeachin n=1 Tax=Tupaia chinensis TaxID=246437 RepID=L9JH32_TUPCH|nr:Neurobeachin [Tupaia chinensis]